MQNVAIKNTEKAIKFYIKDHLTSLSIITIDKQTNKTKQADKKCLVDYDYE